jgi:tyrosyl-tRNA synthetase
VIDIGKAEIHYNSEWFGNKPMSFLMDLAGRFTVARLIEREDFQKRLKEGLDVSMLELLYPLLQGYDSVADEVSADVELGGHDQCLNLLFGRKVQRSFYKPEQDIITTKLLIGADGVKKMSKSVGNYIKIDETPNKMFTQIMAISDASMWDYFALLTDVPEKEIAALKSDVEKEKTHPRDAKMKLASEIVKNLYSEKDAQGAAKEFKKVAQEGNLPSDIPAITIKEKALNIPDLLLALGAVSSKGEARRLAIQNGVKVDGQIKNNWEDLVEIKSEMIVQIGKNKFFKIA